MIGSRARWFSPLCAVYGRPSSTLTASLPSGSIQTTTVLNLDVKPDSEFADLNIGSFSLISISGTPFSSGK